MRRIPDADELMADCGLRISDADVKADCGLLRNGLPVPDTDVEQAEPSP